MVFYTADLHLGHENIIRYCGRPFANAEEMDAALYENWNARITDMDTVYVLGDLFFRNAYPAGPALARMNGKKFLVRGNHDGRFLKEPGIAEHFEGVADLMDVTDEGRRVILCHYPMMAWNGSHRGSYHFYGHLHNSRPDFWGALKDSERAFNAGVDVCGFMPCTFDEVLAYNATFRAAGVEGGERET